MFIARSQFRVVPVLAWWRVPSAVRPVDIGEVAAVERISVADLADPANRLMLRFPSGRSGPAFRIDSMLIWGFTALITDRLLALGGWERPWDAATVRELPAGGRVAVSLACGDRYETAIRDGSLSLGGSGYRGHRAR